MKDDEWAASVPLYKFKIIDEFYEFYEFFIIIIITKQSIGQRFNISLYSYNNLNLENVIIQFMEY